MTWRAETSLRADFGPCGEPGNPGDVHVGLRQSFPSAGCKGDLWPDLIIPTMICFSIKVAG